MSWFTVRPVSIDPPPQRLHTCTGGSTVKGKVIPLDLVGESVPEWKMEDCIKFVEQSRVLIFSDHILT